MSKQSEAKEAQGYVAKPVPSTCSNCKHYTSEITERIGMWNKVYYDESDRRCGLGGFAVKKQATCNRFEHKVTE